METNKTNRIEYITLMSVLSAIAVVFIHTNRCFWTFSYESYWISADVIESLMSFCVPVFFMISGATLIDYRGRYSTKEYFIRRVKRAVIPYVFWCYFGLAYDLFMGYMKPEEITFSKVITVLLASESIEIYWFFPILFGIYLCIPLLSAVSKELRRDVFTYCVVAAFLLNFIVPFIRLISGVYFSWTVNVQVASSYMLFALTGYLLTHYDVSRKWDIIIYIAGAVGLLAQVIGTYYLSVSEGDIVMTFKGFENLPVTMYSVAVFLLIKRIGPYIMRGHSGVATFINCLSSFTLGIYLIHWYILELVEYVCSTYLGIANTSLLYRLIAPIIIIALCILIIWTLRKIPIVRNVLP